jgi:hypothetical protein
MSKFSLISEIIKESVSPNSKLTVNLFGMADKKGFTEQDADFEQLRQGILIEMEHTKDPNVAKKITLDHLAEIPDYYTRLAKMEKEAKAGGN